MKLGMEIPPEWRERLETVRRVLSKSDSLLDVLWRARGGTTLDYVLAGLAASSEVLALLDNDDCGPDAVRRRGFIHYKTAHAEFVCSLLDEAKNLRKEQQKLPGTSVTMAFWKRGKERIFACLYYDNEIYMGPFVQEEGGREDLKVELRKGIWAKGPRLMFSVHVQKQKKRRMHGLDSFRLEPLDPPSQYIGSPDLEWYVNRLKVHDTENLIIQLAGPSGVGKSTLALGLAQRLFGEEATSLVVPASILRQLQLSDVLDLTEIIDPNVLIVDDFTGGDPDHDGASTLALLEHLHKKMKLVVLTKMTEGTGNTRRWTGLRPGRIDDCFHLAEPDKVVRKELMQFFLAELGQADSGLDIKPAWVKKTKGMTGAYIRELMRRVLLFGEDSFKEEAEKLLGGRSVASRRAIRRKPSFTPAGDPIPSNMRKLELLAYCKAASLPAEGNVAALRSRVKEHVSSKVKEEESKK